MIESQSSRDNLIWNTDASYNYYLHGPLVRTELGKYKVQGIDYAYTLQGWLKGINSRVMDPYRDMGEDGSSSGIFTRVSRDVYGYTLGYFANDYKVISGNGLAFIPVYETPNGVTPETGNGLFNGNISHATVYLSKVDGGNVSGYSYLYDQLNRLKEMNQHTVNPLGNTWSNSGINSAYQEKINYDPNGNILAYHRDGANTVGNPLDMDQLKYHYQPGTNKLDYITDTVSSSNYPMDIDDQDTLNYVYDEIGNLISDASEGIIGIHWNVYGKMTGVYKSGSESTTFKYDASGNRISKTYTSPSTGAITTYYLRDPQGNVLSTYRDSVGTLIWDEQHLYGSSRLGIVNIHAAVSEDPVVVSESTPYIYDSSLIGQKVYELSNHLGNVLTTINDKKVGIDENTDNVTDYYLPEVMSASDYYPFGMQQPGRTFSLNDYRYGFNGKENDNEVKGTGNQQDYGMRIYDPRLGRFLSVDPLTNRFPYFTPYQFAGNTPVWATDLDGAEPTISIPRGLTFPDPILTLPKLPPVPVQPVPPIPPAIPGSFYLPQTPTLPPAPFMPLPPATPPIVRSTPIDESTIDPNDATTYPKPPSNLEGDWKVTPLKPGTRGYEKLKEQEASRLENEKGDILRWHKSDKDHPKGHWDFKGGGKYAPWENYTPEGIKIPKGKIYGKDFNPAVSPLSIEGIMQQLKKYSDQKEYEKKMEQYNKDMKKYIEQKKEYDQKKEKYYKDHPETMS